MTESKNKMLYDEMKETDPLILDWLFISPVSFTTSLIIYYLLVTVILPKYMQNRKPFILNNILIGYNAVQVYISAYLFYLSYESWFVHMKASFWKCNSVDRSNDPRAMKTIIALYLYFLSKYAEFLDTVFFVFRKKYNQVSFLHLYHHISTPVFVWYILNYYPGGSFMFILLLNTFVHIFMYFYYLLAAIGPHMQKYLWWKKYITALQMVQFVTIIFHLLLAIYNADCNIPRMVLAIYVADALTLYILFSRFYKKQYRESRNTE